MDKSRGRQLRSRRKLAPLFRGARRDDTPQLARRVGRDRWRRLRDRLGGRVRHGGAPITRGERLLLVGFVGREAVDYSEKLARWASFHAFCKFGSGAWTRAA